MTEWASFFYLRILGFLTPTQSSSGRALTSRLLKLIFPFFIARLFTLFS